MPAHPLRDVYTAREIARAAQVPERLVESLLARGEIATIASTLPAGAPIDPLLDRYVSHAEAVRVVRALRRGDQVGGCDRFGSLLAESGDRRRTAGPAVASVSVHLVAGLAAALIAGLGYVSADEPTEPIEREAVHLVYLALPGPGGGGGGGGLRVKSPPPKAERSGERKLSSPLPARKLPPPIQPTPKPEPPPPPLEAKKLPPILAPVVTAPADQRDVEGVMEKAPAEEPPSQGPGTGAGVGTGSGTGVGEGQGPGLGPGEGGGTGGGPYRPGSGVDPPRLLKEVRADYTDEARRRSITGAVLLEIVVMRNGSVGDVRVVRGLGAGLDERAVQAVRQWRFAAARLKGTPVDVIVEVEVEFRLR